jgi:hypothetical protein
MRSTGQQLGGRQEGPQAGHQREKELLHPTPTWLCSRWSQGQRGERRSPNVPRVFTLTTCGHFTRTCEMHVCMSVTSSHSQNH